VAAILNRSRPSKAFLCLLLETANMRVDQCADEREIVALKEVFGRERVFANPITSGSSANLTMPCAPSRTEGRSKGLPRLEPGGGQLISFAMVYGGQPVEDPRRAFRFASMCSTGLDVCAWSTRSPGAPRSKYPLWARK
jgi:hypothetical protein